MVADYGLALWRDGQQALARRIWDQAEAQCVWGRRLYDALRAVDYPHPLFHASRRCRRRAGYAERGYAAQPRDEEMVADYGLALWRDGQQLARRIWDQAEAQCVGPALTMRCAPWTTHIHCSTPPAARKGLQLRAAPADRDNDPARAAA